MAASMSKKWSGDVSDTLDSYLDAAKFVLDSNFWLYTEERKTGCSGFEGIALRNYFLLLEQLKEVSPRISPQVKVMAATLAVEWKNKIGSGLGIVSRFLFVFSLYIYMTWPDSSRERRFCSFLYVLHNTPEMCHALGFSDMFADIVQNLIRRKHYSSEAAKFYNSFKFMNMTEPEAFSILQEFLEKARLFSYKIYKEGRTNAQDKALNFEVAALRMLINLIEDHELESLVPPRSIESCIFQLENMKANPSQHPTAILYPLLNLNYN